MTPEQFALWGQYYEVEPWGIDADDWRWSMLNANVLGAAGVKDVDPSSFSMRRAIESWQRRDESHDDVSAASAERFDHLVGVR